MTNGLPLPSAFQFTHHSGHISSYHRAALGSRWARASILPHTFRDADFLKIPDNLGQSRNTNPGSPCPRPAFPQCSRLASGIWPSEDRVGLQGIWPHWFTRFYGSSDTLAVPSLAAPGKTVLFSHFLSQRRPLTSWPWPLSRVNPSRPTSISLCTFSCTLNPLQKTNKVPGLRAPDCWC